MKKYAWLALLIIGTIVVYFYYHGAGSGPAESVALARDSIANPGPSQPSDNQTPDISSTLLPRKVRLIDAISDQIARNGISSPEVSDLVRVSQSACIAHSKNIKNSIKATGWASDYLAAACEGFDASHYQGIKDPAPDFLEISIVDGQNSAEEAALNYLKHPDSVFASLQAGMVLMGSGKLPGQVSYGLSPDQLSRALAAANASTMCPGQNGCAGAQVFAASTCLEISCPGVITYESAMRRNLSPAELEASIQLSKWLISIRK